MHLKEEIKTCELETKENKHTNKKTDALIRHFWLGKIKGEKTERFLTLECKEITFCFFLCEIFTNIIHVF